MARLWRRRTRGRSLRVRLIGIVIASVAAGLHLQGGGIFAAVQDNLIDQLDRELDQESEDVKRILATTPDPSDADFTRMAAGLSYLLLSSPDGRVRGEWRAPNAPQAPVLPARLPFGDSGVARFTSSDDRDSPQWRVRAEVLPEGLLVAAEPLDRFDQGRFMGVLVGSGAVTLAVIGFIGGRLVRRGMRPLDEIGAIAQAIGAGELSRRIPTRSYTEINRLAAALNAMLGRLETAFREKEASEERLRRFIADASHELRTPLTSIRGYAEMFRRGAAADPADLAVAMRRIEEESARMSALVEELLLLARLDSAPEPSALSHEPVDLAALAVDAVADATAVEPTRPITYLGPDTLMVSGDESQLRQVLGNLLSNVRRHTPPDTAAVVRLSERDGRAHLEVIDSGPGVPQQLRERIFERFYRADPSRTRARGGAGLGLAIVAAVVAAHGGRCGVEVADPASGTGACFWFEIPVAP